MAASSSSSVLSLYQILVDPPINEEFNAHIKNSIIKCIDKYPDSYSKKFTDTVNIIMESVYIWDKQFLCLIWYMITTSYRKAVDKKETNTMRLEKFKPVLANKLDWFICGLQVSNGKTYDLKSPANSRSRHAIGYVITDLTKHYTML